MGHDAGTVAAVMLADHVRGRANPWWDIYDPFNASRVAKDLVRKEFLKEQALVTKEFVGERLAQHPADELAPGGQIARVGGKIVAMSNDESGDVRMLSATCTHVGCLLAYNGLEKGFDCGCYGSRFGFDGKVLHVPAVAPLEPADAPIQEEQT